MSHITIKPAEYNINGRNILYKGRGSVEIAPKEARATIIAGQNGSVAKQSTVLESFSFSLPVLLGSSDDAFLQSIVNNGLFVEGYIRKPILNRNGVSGAVQYDIFNGTITKTPNRTDNITIDDVEAECVSAYEIDFVGKANII